LFEEVKGFEQSNYRLIRLKLEVKYNLKCL